MSTKNIFTRKWLRGHTAGLLLFIALRDSLVYLTLGIIGLFSLETLLPGFVTTRFNLALPILLQAILFLALIRVVNHYQLTFPDSPRLNRVVAILGSLWLVAILFISLFKYSLPVKLSIITPTLAILSLLWREYGQPHK